jgi:O-methyltransferase involved in polyketide biosynthesis
MPSRTAELVTFFRALESRLPLDARLFEDRYAADLLGAPLKAALTLARVGHVVPAAIDRGWPGTRVSVIVRTRFIDEVVTASRGEQVVILGAGFDTRALRLVPDRRVFDRRVVNAGSRVVFTYLDRSGGRGPAARTVRLVGEPFSFGFDPAELPGYLAERGLPAIEDVSAAELAELCSTCIRAAGGRPRRLCFGSRSPSASPAIPACVAGALRCADDEAEQPQHEQDAECDPERVHGESDAAEDGQNQQQDYEGDHWFLPEG